MTRPRQSLAEQLAPLAKRGRASLSTVHKISQVTIKVVGGTNQTSNFEFARRQCLTWLSNRAGQQLPKHAWEGKSFALDDVGAQRTAAVALAKPQAWAARLDDADKTVPQRYWTTELAAACGADAVLFGCRLQCATLGEDQPFARSVPGVVQQLVNHLNCEVDGRQISLHPWIVSTESGVDELVDLLCMKSRQRDVLVFALPESSENPTDTIIPVDVIARRTIGAAHIAIITGPASYALSDRVGKEFSVFMQAVRRYRPGLDIETGQPFSHPLALPNRILNWPGGGPDAFANLVVDRTLSATISGQQLENELPSFQEFSSVAIEISRSQAKATRAPNKELLELAELEIKQLQSQLQETKETTSALLEQADAEISQLKASISQVQEDSRNQRWRISHLEEAINKRQEVTREQVPIPDSFQSLDEWCRQYLSGSVAVHNRAIRAAKKSSFQNVAFAYSVLLLLRDKYAPMRREGGLDKKTAYDAALSELGLDETSTFGGARSGEEGDAYFVEFGGRRRELDRHLKGSNSRDERFGFRLYFFWDDETDQVVVGWFPSHLPNRIS